MVSCMFSCITENLNFLNCISLKDAISHSQNDTFQPLPAVNSWYQGLHWQLFWMPSNPYLTSILNSCQFQSSYQTVYVILFFVFISPLLFCSWLGHNLNASQIYVSQATVLNLAQMKLFYSFYGLIISIDSQYTASKAKKLGRQSQS